MAKRPDVVLINKRKRTCCLVDFAVPVDHKVKMKESENERKWKWKKVKRLTNTWIFPESWKAVEYDRDTNRGWVLWNRSE